MKDSGKQELNYEQMKKMITEYEEVVIKEDNENE